MTSFISGTLLKQESCCKFMLKYDLKNYFRQFTKTLIICFQWNSRHTELILCNYIWLEQLNACVKYKIRSGKNVCCVE